MKTNLLRALGEVVSWTIFSQLMSALFPWWSHQRPMNKNSITVNWPFHFAIRCACQECVNLGWLPLTHSIEQRETGYSPTPSLKLLTSTIIHCFHSICPGSHSKSDDLHWIHDKSNNTCIGLSSQNMHLMIYYIFFLPNLFKRQIFDLAFLTWLQIDILILLLMGDFLSSSLLFYSHSQL